MERARGSAILLRTLLEFAYFWLSSLGQRFLESNKSLSLRPTALRALICLTALTRAAHSGKIKNVDAILKKIKRLIIQGQYVFTAKADAERLGDGLSQEDVLESILNATFVRSKRSRSLKKQDHRERIYIIESFNYDGMLIYTKGVIRKQNQVENFYVLISAKQSTYGNAIGNP